ncbi:ankyrin 3 [Fusarium denticulatum]|uniref:Ankyrin 3 n=1 Tax=Fusarium denticulatum TaxID=48507 RepID=A0A8H5TFP7_9HYPO|nr:ankyrin 3 [Fusarium denticulatum]
MDTTFYAKFRGQKPSRRKPLASPASHKRLLKRLWHLFKQKSPHDSETPLASKRSSSAPSNSSDSSGDGVVIYSDTGCPRIDGDQRVVTVDSEPAILRFLDRIAQRLKLELDLDNNDGHKTHGYSQKRHADNPDQGSREEKKQKQSQGSRDTGGGGGGGKKNGGGNGGKQPPDGHGYSVLPRQSDPQNKPPFACPFQKLDPVRYDCCTKVRLKRPSDVSQHIKRCHVLKDLKEKTANADDAEPADSVELVGNAEAEEEVALYCPKCRMEFFGTTAEANLRKHLPCQTSQPATIEQTGMLLPAEFVQLNAARTKASGDIPKWNAMCKTCFPNKPVPKSPYFALPGQEAVTVLPEVEVETLVPRSQGGEIIRRALNDCPSHFLFIEGEVDAIVDQVLNGLYPGSSGAEQQTSTDIRLEVQQRQMPQRRVSQRQISQKQISGAVTSTAFDLSDFPAAPQAYPPSHQVYQSPSAIAPFAPTPHVVPQNVTRPGPQSNAQTQRFHYDSPFDDATVLALPSQHSLQMSPPAAGIEAGPPVPFRSAPGPVASETSPASQATYNSSLYDGGFDGTGFSIPNQSGADVPGFPSLEAFHGGAIMVFKTLIGGMGLSTSIGQIEAIPNFPLLNLKPQKQPQQLSQFEAGNDGRFAAIFVDSTVSRWVLYKLPST